MGPRLQGDGPSVAHSVARWRYPGLEQVDGQRVQALLGRAFPATLIGITTRDCGTPLRWSALTTRDCGMGQFTGLLITRG